jgi:hypothetical protein
MERRKDRRARLHGMLETTLAFSNLGLHYHDSVPATRKVIPTVRQWWKEYSAHNGLGPTLPRMLAIFAEFLSDSTPSRRKQRYGDVDYDWDHRVDTTAATIGWRSRLIGLFHSAYQPSEPALFREMLGGMDVDFREFTFIDIGSGKGRALLMAADFPFHRVLGVELLPELHSIAQENINRYVSPSQQCFDVQSVCADGRCCFIYSILCRNRACGRCSKIFSNHCGEIRGQSFCSITMRCSSMSWGPPQCCKRSTAQTSFPSIGKPRPVHPQPRPTLECG